MLARASATPSTGRFRKRRLYEDNLKIADRTGGLPTSLGDMG
jgi:hypothetical protein